MNLVRPIGLAQARPNYAVDLPIKGVNGPNLLGLIPRPRPATESDGKLGGGWERGSTIVDGGEDIHQAVNIVRAFFKVETGNTKLTQRLKVRPNPSHGRATTPAADLESWTWMYQLINDTSRAVRL